jgi:Protein phosphatase 2C
VAESMSWRFASASTKGLSHVESGLPCQDASLCTLLQDPEGNPVLIAAVSDGAGSAAHSEIGSRLACDSFHEEITSLIRRQGSAAPLERVQMETWLAAFSQRAASHAEELSLTLRDLACTFIAAVVTPTWSAFCQVGDGGIVVNGPAEGTSEPEPKFELIFWPEQGEYANETYFATMNGAAEHLQFRVRELAVREIALFSDGLQRLVLKFDTREAFSPFFHRMLQPVRRVTGLTGDAHELSRDLGTYLGSSIISGRTDDDVSLILATRCPEPAGAAPIPLSGPVPATALPEPGGRHPLREDADPQEGASDGQICSS